MLSSISINTDELSLASLQKCSKNCTLSQDQDLEESHQSSGAPPGMVLVPAKGMQGQVLTKQVLDQASVKGSVKGSADGNSADGSTTVDLEPLTTKLEQLETMFTDKFVEVTNNIAAPPAAIVDHDAISAGVNKQLAPELAQHIQYSTELIREKVGSGLQDLGKLFEKMTSMLEVKSVILSLIFLALYHRSGVCVHWLVCFPVCIGFFANKVEIQCKKIHSLKNEQVELTMVMATATAASADIISEMTASAARQASRYCELELELEILQARHGPTASALWWDDHEEDTPAGAGAAPAGIECFVLD